MQRSTRSRVRHALKTMLLLAGASLALSAHAEITIGVVLSLTGPAASLGQPAANTVKLWPSQIAGQPLRVIVLNDNSDTSETTKLVSKLIDEDHVDVIVGPSLTPNSIAAVGIAGREQTPVIALGGGNVIVEPVEGPKVWAFKMSAPEAISVAKATQHMVGAGTKTVGVISISTSYGDGFTKALQNEAAAHEIKVTDVEHYAAADVSVTPQVLKLLATNPDAIYIMSFGTPGVLPELELRQRGYKGAIYQTHGVANQEFLKLGGASVEGTLMAVAPVLVAEQLPESSPVKKVALQYVNAYEAQNGPHSRSLFGSTAWTAMSWLQASVPVALGNAKPGTVEFRRALRDALENMHEVASPEGVFNMGPTNHNGLDQRAQVMVRVENGNWKLLEE